MEQGGIHLEPSEGKLTYTNTELASKCKQVQTELTRLRCLMKGPKLRKKHTLEFTGQVIPPSALAGGILVVPSELSGDILYILPSPAVLKPHILDRGYEIDIRNDSNKQVTLITDCKSVRIDGGNTVGPNSGSRWYVAMSPLEEGYEVIRLA